MRELQKHHPPKILAMEEPSLLSYSRREDDVVPEFSSLREWGLKARISRENTLSRRFSSSSYIPSFREDPSKSSFRSINLTISSTASSPGHPLREDIDPSTYSFTSALKALQARSINTWECSSPDGFLLNSKWNDAEKYICNPLSGEVPLECLSAKTLSGRSFRSLGNRITMSAPLIYASHSRFYHSTTAHQEKPPNPPVQEKKQGRKTRDVGTQSTPPEISSSSPSPSSTPSIQERPTKFNLAQVTDSTNSSSKSKCEEEEGELKEAGGQGELKEAGGRGETRVEEEEDEEGGGQGKRAKNNYVCLGRHGGNGGGGCLSLRNLWTRRRQREKHKPNKRKDIFPCPITGC